MFIRTILVAATLMAVPTLSQAQDLKSAAMQRVQANAPTLNLKTRFVANENADLVRRYLAENLSVTSDRDDTHIHYFAIANGRIAKSETSDVRSLRKRPGRLKLDSTRAVKNVIPETAMTRKRTDRVKLDEDQAVPGLGKLLAEPKVHETFFPGHQNLPSKDFLSGLSVKDFIVSNVSSKDGTAQDIALKAMEAIGRKDGLVIVTSSEGISMKGSHQALVGFGSWN